MIPEAEFYADVIEKLLDEGMPIELAARKAGLIYDEPLIGSEWERMMEERREKEQ